MNVYQVSERVNLVMKMAESTHDTCYDKDHKVCMSLLMRSVVLMSCLDPHQVTLKLLVVNL